MSLSKIFSLASFFILSQTQASVLVNLPGPYPQYSMGSTIATQYIAGNNTGTPNGGAHYNGSYGYRFLTLGAVSTDTISIDVSTNSTITVASGQQLVVGLSTATLSGGTIIPILRAQEVTGTTVPALCTATTCGGSSGSGNGGYKYANYRANSVLRISFSVTDFCQQAGVSSNWCSGGAPVANVGTTVTQTIYVTFGVVATTDLSTLVGSSNISTSFDMAITDIAPTMACPAASGIIENYYFPGDQSIYIDAGNYRASAGTGSPLQYLGVFAKKDTSPNNLPMPATVSSAPVTDTGGYVAVGGGRQTVEGFENATSSTDLTHSYSVSIYAQNQAGLYSTSSCDIFELVRAQPITGVLSESKCFIATAAFHDGRAAPVMMLRKFRDQILSQFSLGKKFIETYYEYSPALAEWAWDKPFIRSIALRALAPIELFAWATLQLANAEEVKKTQPYIDRLKGEMGDAEPKIQVGDTYIEEIKKNLEPETSAEGYSENIKKGLEEKESAKGYSENLKSKLPAEKYKESPIKMVKEKRDRYPRPDYPEIKTAVGFKVGVSPGIKVINTNGSAQSTFERVYGTGFHPDIIFHAERQIFHSENLGSLGLGMDFGVTYSEGYGQLLFAFGSQQTTKSLTKFSLIQVPLLADLYYRFNLLRILRPYAGVGVGPLFFTELRKDKQKDKRGYSFVYTASVGASLLLDFLDSKTAGDSYLANGIQHSYLFAEYTMMNTFSKTGVLFERGGIYSGFLFEY